MMYIKIESSAKLMSLRIPTGWIVKWNLFMDEEPIVEKGEFVNALSFSEDLLIIERDHQNTFQKWVLDLGFFPESDPNGRYRLTLMKENFNNILIEFESKSKDKIKEKIEEWLEFLSTDDDARKLNNKEQ